MKTQLALLLSTASLLQAGSPDLETTLAAKPEAWLKPTADIRARYEFRDIQGATDPSNALTFRERLGFKTQAWNGFSALVEGEFSQAAVNDYSGGSPEAHPFKSSQTLIADPKTNELNQAYLQYAGLDTIVKAGRQRIIYDNAAFIGNVGWRQNEQTFDGISLANTSISGLTLNYAYIDQVNRIYGSDADGPLAGIKDNVQDIDANVNLFNASYSGIKGITLGGYAYFMAFNEKSNWDNNTFGVNAKGKLLSLALYGELAYQDKAGFAANNQAFYANFSATKALGDQSVTMGVTSLGAGFKTPLATIHPLDGFADAFTAGRIEGNHNGLTDVCLSYTLPICFGVKWVNAVHAFGDNEVSTGYGWEYDSVLTKKFNDNFTAIAKFAQFEAKDDAFIGGTTLRNISQISAELDYTF